MLAAAFCFTAVFLSPTLIFKSYWGILGGLIQGTGFVVARILMLDQKSIRQSISTGFGISFLVTLIALSVNKELPLIFKLQRSDVAITVVIAIAVQYGFFYLYKSLDSQRASLLILSRLPWALALESVILGTSFLFMQVASSLLVGAGAVLLLLDARIKK